MHRQRVLLTGGAVLGVLATVVPWMGRVLQLTEAGVHSDLWFTLVLFLAILVIGLSRSQKRTLSTAERWMTGVCAALAMVIGAVNLPDLWDTLQRASQQPSAVSNLMASYAMTRIVYYVVVIIAGMVGLISVLLWWGGAGTLD